MIECLYFYINTKINFLYFVPNYCEADINILALTLYSDYWLVKLVKSKNCFR